MTILDTLKKEHDLLNGRLTLLKNEIHVWSHHGEPDYDLLHLLIQYFSIFPDEIHHKKEDRIYEALIQNNVLETAYLSRLKSEHEQMSGLKAQFSKNLAGLVAHDVAPKWSMIIDVGKYIEMQELHMADEESQFLPLARTELSEKHLLEVAATIQSELITDSARESFEALNRINADIETMVKKKK